jgi:1-deoxy-D-xylulose-5-phosphate reductoisomerase
MRIPIAYALAWPERMDSGAERLDLARIARFDFEQPDEQRFPALKLARSALGEGGSAPAVLNAANEIGVAAFLAGRIRFTEIADLVSAALDKNLPAAPETMAEVIEVDRMTRIRVADQIDERCS